MNLIPKFLSGFFLISLAAAHEEPTSFVDLKVNTMGIDASFVASITDLAHYLPDTEPAMLLQGDLSDERKNALSALLPSQFKITADGAPIRLELVDIIPAPEKRDLRLEFRSDWKAAPRAIRLDSRMFPYDDRHRTYVNVYIGDKLSRQEAFDRTSTGIEFQTVADQGLWIVIGEFIYEGIHHIFIGPDHILFVIGLLLLGGSLRQLIKIVTTFTIAHSITLCLATFRILSPPASVMEPVIALSIVFVGAHALLGTKTRDPRLIFAFAFGLIHGFGFASVLQEMMLPPGALGWSLFAFNFGVEIGQACIVLTIAPLLALLRHRRPGASERVIAGAAICVTAAGAFWFFQRVIG